MINKEDYSHINGWGIDADPLNEPTYPIKNYTGDDHERLNWERPVQQQTNIEVLHSNERPTLSAVFGTSVPPNGLSGMIRRYAFKYSESSYGHWLPLLLADRINVIEGVIDDLSHHKIPNIFLEKGWKSEFRHNPKGLAKKVVITSAVVGVLVFCLSKSKKKI